MNAYLYPTMDARTKDETECIIPYDFTSIERLLLLTNTLDDFQLSDAIPVL
jgi:hypothetical protein